MPTQKHSPIHIHIHIHMATPNLTFSLYLFSFLLFPITNAYADSNYTTQAPLTPPPPPPSSAFKPGVAVVVGILTTVFSLTFLLLLYIKHCNSSGNIDGAGNTNVSSRGVPLPALAGRKNSGIDRCVIESLPIFRFGSLTGQKDGLDCAVCLTRFEASEVLRLLPKCKHAFHVECVDTWLDAHSTCPLCRYRVDPEDILLLEDTQLVSVPPPPSQPQRPSEIAQIRRVSGRHSSVGEREGGLLQIILEGGECDQSRKTTSYRRSLDSAGAGAGARKKNHNNETVGVGVGCFVRPRKDGMLLMTQETEESVERRLEHRIIVSPSAKSSGGVHRWSDVQPSDLLYLTSEMIIKQQQQQQQQKQNAEVPLQLQLQLHWNRKKMMMMEMGKSRSNNHRQKSNDEVEEGGWDGSGVINSRSVSEITGLSRFLSNNNHNHNNSNNRPGQEGEGEGEAEAEAGRREEGLVSRWLAWISISKPQALPAVR